MAEREMMYSTRSEKACPVGSGRRMRRAHEEVDRVGKALVQYLAEFGTAVLPWAGTVNSA